MPCSPALPCKLPVCAELVSQLPLLFLHPFDSLGQVIQTFLTLEPELLKSVVKKDGTFRRVCLVRPLPLNLRVVP